MTFLLHDDEELSQSDMQLPHVSGVRTAPLSQTFHQGDVRPQFVHHARILTAWVAISVPFPLIYSWGFQSKHKVGVEKFGKAV